jgi:hypothetical protein
MTTRNTATWLKLVATTALGLDALFFLVGAVFVLVVDGYEGAIFVPFLATGVLGFFAWLGLRAPGGAGGCLLPLALFGFCFWALGATLSGVSLEYFLFFLVFWSLIPLIAGIVFLVARWIEGPSQRSGRARLRAETPGRWPPYLRS